MFKKDQLNQLALPLILSNVVSLVISLCDQAVMGHLSITSFAAVGIVAGFINRTTRFWIYNLWWKVYLSTDLSIKCASTRRIIELCVYIQ